MLVKRRDGWIGVDRGAGSVKVAQLRRQGDTLRVAVAASTPRWSNTADAVATDKQRCQREIDSIRAMIGSWRCRDAAATASMADCSLSTSDAGPPASDSDRCHDTWTSGDREAYTLGMPQSSVAALCDGLRLGGLRCRVVDGAPLALARALRIAPGYSADDLVGGLDWGVSGALFVAAKGGQAVYARKLKDCGFGRVLASVAADLGLSESDAGTLVYRHGVAAADHDDVSAAVGKALNRATTPLLTEARRTLSHLGAKLKSRAPQRMWVFGAGGAAPGLAPSIGERLDVDADSWRPAGMKFDETADEPACLFGVAIALSALAWEAA